MDPNSIFILLDFVIFAVGIYCAYSWYYMRTHNRVHENRITIPKTHPVVACKDPAGYIAYMNPRLLAFAVACIVLGGIVVLSNFQPIPREILFASMAILFAVIIWFGLVIRKALGLYWPPVM